MDVLTDAEIQKSLAALHMKVEEILEFQRELKPFLPLLSKVTAFVDNPAMRFRRKVSRDG